MIKPEHIFAFVISAIANMYYFGLALAGTGYGPPLEARVPYIFIFSLGSGLVLATFAKTPFIGILSAVGFPCAGHALMMIQGAIEEKGFHILRLLVVPTGIWILASGPLGIVRGTIQTIRRCRTIGSSVFLTRGTPLAGQESRQGSKSAEP